MIFSRKTKSTTALIIDIGSSSVGGALVSFAMPVDYSKRPVFLKSVRDHFSFNEELNFKKFEMTMLASLEKTLTTLREQKERPKHFFCVLSAPWYVTETRAIHFQKEAEFTVRRELIDELIDREIQIFKTEQASRYKDIGTELSIVESKVSHMSLNGYRVEDPINKRAQSIDLELYIVLSPKLVLKEIENRIEKVFSRHSVKFISYSYASFSVIRDLFQHEHSFLMVDIGGEVSDVMLVKDNSIQSSVSFPYGKHTLIRMLAKQFSLSPREFLSVARAYQSGDLSYTETERLAGALKIAEKDWLEYFQKGLVHISNEISLPNTLFVTADDNYIDWFIDFLKRETFTQYTASERSFTIFPLSREFLQPYVNIPSPHKKDPLLMFESLFIRKIL